MSPTINTRQGLDLTTEEQIALAVRRFAAQPKVALATSAGRIGKTQAIREIKKQTRLGRALVEIEMRTIDLLAEELARRQQAARRRRAAKSSGPPAARRRK